MSTQKFGEESNWKHEPKTEHYEEDKFGKGTNTRNWKKNLDEKLEASKEEGEKDELVDEEDDQDSRNASP